LSGSGQAFGVALAAAAMVLLTGCGGAEPAGRPSAAVQTSFPDLDAARGDPTLPGLTSARPQPGAVDRLTGPFDDRFELTDLRLAAGAVTGELTVTSDVSQLLDLQVLAGFYDGEGRYLGSARFDQHALHEEPGHGVEGDTHDEAVAFTIEAPAAFRARVASAAVGVPVLVNE
jgi:hypothetical protein